MRVTIIGPGNMGRGIATRLLAGGHNVLLVGRDRRQADALVRELEPLATGDASISAAPGPEQAVPDSDVVILALPYAANLAFAQREAPLLGGKVVVDISNPLNERYDGLVTGCDTSAAETIRAVLPADARLVKAFNTTFAGTLQKGDVAGQTLDVFIAGDDEDANGRIEDLVRTSGMRPIQAGRLERARQLESLGLLGITLQEPLGTGFMSGWKLVTPGAAPREEATGFPRNAVVGVIDDPASVGSAVAALTEAGLDESHVQVLYGTEGKQRVESASEGQGLLSEFMALGFEADHTRRHLQELDAGHAVVLVEADDDTIGQRASRILEAQGGHFINYYSRWTARNVVP